MCLNIKGTVSFIAKEDIICYKFFEEGHRPDGTPAMVSPYRRECIWEPGETKTEERHILPRKDITLHGDYVIGEGYFHSFVSMANARFCANTMNMVYGKRYALWECIIPKGTKYYAGWTDNGESSYASMALRPVEEIKI